MLVEMADMTKKAPLDIHRNNTYWWHDHGFEEEERDEMGIEIEKYDPPEVQVPAARRQLSRPTRPEYVENGTIELYFVETKYQLADLFTKAIPKEQFEYLVHRIGMRYMTPTQLERLTKSSS
ncbi:hypothetical protein Tco_0191070 [Tanacetum coccineum]